MSEEKKERVALYVAKFFEKFFKKLFMLIGAVLMFIVELTYNITKAVLVIALAALVWAIASGRISEFIVSIGTV